MSRYSVAVTGHRDLVETEALREALSHFFDLLLKEHEDLTLLSALAEGADRFVAKIFLEKRVSYPDIRLEVPMPFERARYEEDFDADSCEAFRNYINEASLVYALPHISGQDAYQALGIYLVEHSDMLLALWDGKINHKVGGTADVVSYAKAKTHALEHLLVQRKHS